MKKSYICIVLFLLILPIQKSFTDEYIVRDPVVLILIKSEDNVEDEYRQVIEDTVKIEFESAKLQILLANDIENSEIISEEDAYELAEKVNADFIITGIYSIRSRLLQIEFVWYDAQFRKVSEPVAERIIMDLTFDESVSETVNEIIFLMNERIGEFPFVVLEESVSPEAADATDTTDIIDTNMDNTEPEVTEHDDSIDTSYTTVIIENNHNPLDLYIPETEKRSNYFEVAAGFSPFVSIGRAKDYFNIGFVPAAYFNYVFNKDFGKFGLGIFAGINGFNVEASGSKNHFLIPFGANFIYKTPFKKTFNFFARVSAGPSIFIVNFNNETLSKIIFYLLGSAGLDIQITEMFGLAVEAGYFIFFEEEDPIIGFAPGLYCYFRI